MMINIGKSTFFVFLSSKRAGLTEHQLSLLLQYVTNDILGLTKNCDQKVC